MRELRATYRLHLGGDVDFAFARSLVPYLTELGVSHLYLSPCLQARSGSTHGYDIVDPRRVSEDLGGEEGLRALAGDGLGLILDIVPNHMGTGDENPWWADEAERARVFDVDPETGFYRRFFDIDDLAAVRQERDDVFALTHGKILELLRDGAVDGVRVDHPDGLADPAGYLRKLRDAGAPAVWVEKILSAAHPPEPLRDWPVDGTVGYEFLNDAQAVFVDPAGEEPLTALYGELTGERRSFAEVALEAQLEQATTTFARELEWLKRLGPGVPGLADALAALPVYRTYVEPWNGRVDPLDREAIAAAGVDEALARVLVLEERGHDELVTRFQQTSPPVTAKGVEDTAFYRYNRLLALNEVGGDPGRFGIPVDRLHAANLERARRFPRNLLITSTHDTKRSADVRARIGVLAGMAEAWGERVRRWEAIAAPLVEGGAPDANERYLIWQTLVGVWPIGPERLDAYLEKALREAKVHTSWVEQDRDWEARAQRFARRVLDDREFRESFDPFCAEVAVQGERAALGQVALKLCSPGVPDVYQGDELDFRALVDPDNRRPVDWDARRRALESPPPKLHLIRAALALRARRPGAFAGAYEPIEAGPGVCAFSRGEGEVLVVVPVRDWQGSRLDPPAGLGGAWRDVCTGALRELRRGVSVGELAAGMGVAVLERA